MKPHIEIYTDGSIKKAKQKDSKGIGGWAAILLFKDRRKEIYGTVEDTTISRMEVQAVLEALKKVKMPCNITVYSDSQYTVKCGSGEFKRKANLDLWLELDDIAEQHDITWQWVKAHNGNLLNERADVLAKLGAGIS